MSIRNLRHRSRQDASLPSRWSAVRIGVVGAAFVILAGASVAMAFNGQVVKAGRGVSATSETQFIGNVSTYATRQSNLNGGGGGAAAYGCRASAGTRPCLFAFNLHDGQAFQFRSRGVQAGTIIVDPPAGKTANDVIPFTTNANGVAKGLNADRVDGHPSTDFVPATAIRKLPPTKLAAGQSVPLLTVGALTVTGRCRVISSTNVAAELILTSSQAGASVHATGGITVPNLAANTEATLLSVSGPLAAPDFSSTGTLGIVGPDGTVLTGSAYAGRSVQGAACIVGGNLLAT